MRFMLARHGVIGPHPMTRLDPEPPHITATALHAQAEAKRDEVESRFLLALANYEKALGQAVLAVAKKVYGKPTPPKAPQ